MSSLKRGLQQVAAAGLRLPVVRSTVRAAARAGVLPEAVWRRLPVTGPVPLAIPGHGTVAYHSTLMDHLGRVLFFGGPALWEPEVLRVLPGLAAAAGGVVDVGAHTGLFTLLALAVNPAARAVVVEPVLGNARLVEQNLAANRMAERCVLVAAAAAAVPGVVTFDAGPVEVPMTAAMTPDAGPGGRRVPAVSIDSVAGWLAGVDLVKIDVEGFEHDVMTGAADTLAAHRPTVMVECLPGSRLEAVHGGLLDRLGYRRFHLWPDRAEEVRAVAPRADGSNHNYLLVARDEALRQVASRPGAA